MNKFILTILSCIITNIYGHNFSAEIALGNFKINDFALSTSGEHAYIATSSKILKFSLKTRSIIDSILFENNTVISKLCISEDEKTISCISNNATLHIANWDNNRKKAQFPSEIKPTCIDFKKASNTIVVGTKEGSIYVFDTLANNSTILKLHNNLITDIELSPDALFIATTCLGGLAMVFDLANNKKHVLIKNKSPMRTISFSNDSKKIIAAGDNGKLLEWLLNSSNYFSKLNSHKTTSWITDAAYSSDGNATTFCTASGKILIHTFLGMSYLFKSKSSLLKVNLIPNNQNQLFIMALNYNKQLLIVDPSNMKISTK